MTVSTPKITQDATVRESVTSRNLGETPWLAVGNETNDIRRAFVYAARPFPRGATVVDAKLRLYTRDVWSGGPITVTAKVVTQKWKETGAGGITWADQPDVTAANVTANVANNAPVGTLVEFDVTSLLQTVASGGSAYHGFRLTIAAATTHRFHSAESTSANLRPVLEVEWGVVGDGPVDLKPSGGLSVSKPQPTLVWELVDTEGNEQAEFQVQIDDADTFSSVLHDSGWVVSEDSEYDLSTTGFTVANGVVRYWRVRVRDGNGIESEWSDPVSFRRDDKGVLTITSPGATTDDVTPPITHTFTGTTQEVVRYILEREDTDGWVSIYNSGPQATVATSFTLPQDLIDNETDNYRIRVFVWDNIDRVATPGDPRYVEDVQEFAYVRDGTPAAVTSLTVTDATDEDEAPGVVVEWQRAAQPDYFALKIDGKIKLPRIDPVDVFVSGTTYRTVVYFVVPRSEHEFEVEAVTLSGGRYKHSDGNVTTDFTPNPKGVWLVAPDYNLNVFIAGKDPFEKPIGESGTTYFPINRRDPVRVRDSVRGYEGSFRGLLTAGYGKTGAEWRNRFETMKGLPADADVWLVFSDNAFPVILGVGEVTNLYHDRFAVSCEYWQVGRFPMELRR